LLHILRHAKGRYGSTLDYLAQTALSLRQHQVHDREIERQMALAQRHGLLDAQAGIATTRALTAPC
jgi:cation transport protein ChaC